LTVIEATDIWRSVVGKPFLLAAGANKTLLSKANFSLLTTLVTIEGDRGKKINRGIIYVASKIQRLH
jgi:hypothetical protein